MRSVLILLGCLLGAGLPFAADPMSFEQLASVRSVGSIAIAPDGGRIAFTLSIPRDLSREEDGGAWSELRLADSRNPAGRPFIQGEVNISQVRFSPDGAWVTYVAKRGDDKHASLYGIPVDGGESRRLVEFDAGISAYELSPDGRRVAFIAVPAEDKARKAAKKKGFTQEVYEEDWRPRRLYLVDVAPFDGRVAQAGEKREPRPVELKGESIFSLQWLPGGDGLVVTLAPRPLIDDQYMKRRIRVIGRDGAIRARIDNPGKLGSVAVSPDGEQVAFISAADPNDPRDGRLMLAPIEGGSFKDLMPDLQAHVTQIDWMDDDHLLAIVARGAETELVKVHRGGRTKRLGMSGSDAGVPLMNGLDVAASGRRVALRGESPRHPQEVFAFDPGSESFQRMTDSNPWLADVQFGVQEVIRHNARDGLELEGVLMRPAEPKLGSPAPLILAVHGGPEAHVSNGWLSNYSRLGQLAAGRGYAVFYPNYRGSTGRGVEFSKLGQGDAAGKEFSDLVDAVDHLVAMGVADANRVGITGGSYGGYATAWCSTYYTDRFRAGVMFVGISNKVSKGFTTDIPVEDKMVHTLFDPWTKWQFSLERSPLYHAEKSRTPLLIGVGKEDPRVHPSQSLQMYRALKLIDKTPVRLVQYPGEGHGNRRAASRDDYARRVMRWFDHFLLQETTDLPPWNLERYTTMGDEEDGANR